MKSFDVIMDRPNEELEMEVREALKANGWISVDVGIGNGPDYITEVAGNVYLEFGDPVPPSILYVLDREKGKFVPLLEICKPSPFVR